jgi:putative transposase
MRKLYVPARERRHRLRREAYRGYVTAAFHACVAGRQPALTDPQVVAALRAMLSDAAERHGCRVLAYCFMPDHVHVLLQGLREDADLWAAIVRWKGVSGRWLAGNAAARWQKDFYDVLLRIPYAVEEEIEYVLLNPVRWGMARDWWDYPHSWRAE